MNAAAVVRFGSDAMFTGPDTGSIHPVPGTKDTDDHGKFWTKRFVADERGSGRVAAALHHDYAGQDATGVSVPAAIDAMLPRDWTENRYPALFDHVLAPAQAFGVPRRMTECHDHTGGVDGTSKAFAAALGALDYMPGHATHGAIARISSP